MKRPFGISRSRWARMSELGYVPTPTDIRECREALGLSRVEAGQLLRKGPRTWSKWETGERSMDPCFWHLWILLATRPEG